MNGADSNAKSSLVLKIFVIFGLTAPFVTFAIALSPMAGEIKIALVALVAIANTLLYFASRKSLNRSLELAHQEEVFQDRPGPPEISLEKLAMLDEASKFFTASLDQSEMFRLVTSSVKEIISFEATVLFRPSPSNESVSIVEQTFDIDAAAGKTFQFENCLAGISYLSGEIELDANFEIETRVFGESKPQAVISAAAIPLVFEGRVLAVFELLMSEPIGDRSAMMEQLEALRTRITPLFLGSFASDRSISRAFTDAVTTIPNERALFMVLDNQLAESHRFRDERPLSVMALDLKNFRVVNQEYGHVTGDAILSIAAARIRSQLRKMDFLARFENDEFVVVLPLIDEKAIDEVAKRIRGTFTESKFCIDAVELSMDLNFGAASFWKDGETSQQLVQQAQLRKRHAKAADPSNVVLFPKEYVN